MRGPFPVLTRRTLLAAAAVSPALLSPPLLARPGAMLTGANLIEDPAAPFGSSKARESFRLLAEAGANMVALIPFFWQAHAADPNLVRGSALPRDRLRRGVRDAVDAGLQVLVKPHVWVPERWAGSVVFTDESAWKQWFAAYEAALLECAETAQETGAVAFSIGTELEQTSARPEWIPLIEKARRIFAGQLTYVAHNAAEAERFGFWDRLDIVSISTYPPLGAATDRHGWRVAMERELGALRRLADRHGKPAWLGEIGLRSARGATRKPWESAEERAAPADPGLQRDVLQMWFDIARAHVIEAAFVWRWLSDPAGGGMHDTDFTIQNKPAQDLLGTR